MGDLPDADFLFDEFAEASVASDQLLGFEDELPSIVESVAEPASRGQLTTTVAAGVASVILTQTLEAIGMASFSLVKLLGMTHSSDDSSDEDLAEYFNHPRPKLTHSKSCPVLPQRPRLPY